MAMDAAYLSAVAAETPALARPEAVASEGSSTARFSVCTEGAADEDMRRLHRQNYLSMAAFIDSLESFEGHRGEGSSSSPPRTHDAAVTAATAAMPSSASTPPPPRPPADKPSVPKSVAVALALGAESSPVWGCLDCGATRHVFGRRGPRHLTDLRPPTATDRLMTAGGDIISPVEVGKFALRCCDPATGAPLPPLILEDVSRIPSSPLNLLSVSLLGCKGCKLSLEKDNSWLHYQGRRYEVVESQGLFFVRLDKVLGSEQSSTLRGLASMQSSFEDNVELDGEELACAATLDLWHRRLGFEQKAKLKFCFSKDVVAGSGIPTETESLGQPHPATKFFVPRRLPVSTERQVAEPVHRVGDRVSMDMIGPFVRSISGQRQWGLVAVDHYTCSSMLPSRGL